ncbi:MAG: hypothetical protein R3E08_08195 [Thiotrichaceae bacterium]
MLGLLLGLLVIGVVVWWSAQTERVKVSIQSEYIEGNTVDYALEWKEEQRPKRVMFAVRNSPVRETWEVTPLMRKKSGSFSTIGWETTQYTYLVTVTERNDTSYTLTGTFELQKRDIVQPTVEVAGIHPHYSEGEAVHYSVSCSDNRSLKQVSFVVQGSQFNQQWQVNDPIFTQEGTINTTGWAVNREYTYVSVAEDGAGNKFEKTGTFFIEGLDKVAPVGKIVGIFQDYHLGDSVNFSIDASDDRALQDIEFTIENGLVRQIWHTNNRSSHQQSSFTTTGWQAGNYEYVLKVSDSNGNISVGKSSFTLGEVDKMPPVLTYKDIMDHYTVGDVVNYSLEATDNKELDKITLAVTPSAIQEMWVTSGTNYKLHASFSTKDWAPGNYTYKFTAIDKANNSTGEITGMFSLTPPSKTPDIASLLIECKEHLAADRLMQGSSGSAFECYKQVLEIDDKNAEAFAGIQSIEARYRDLIENNLKNNELDKAATFITRLEQVNSKADGIDELRRKLKQAQNVADTPPPAPPPPAKPTVSAVKATPLAKPTRSPKTSLKQQAKRVIQRKQVAAARSQAVTPKLIPVPEPAAVVCRTCNCSDVLTKLSIGVEPLNQEEKAFLRSQCR